MKKYVYLVTLCVLLHNGLQAQELSTYNLYMQNGYLYNPALSIEGSELKAFLNSHLQWGGFEGAPEVNTFGIHGAITETSGVGMLASNNSSGLINKFTVNMTYAYLARFSKEHYLQMGAGIGFVSDKLKQVNEYTDITDELILNNDFNKTSFSSSAGLAYYLKKFEAQLVFPQLVQRNQFNLYTIGILAYNHEMNVDWALRPSVMVRTHSTSPVQYDLNLMANWRNSIWAQGGYRSNNSLLFSLGFIVKRIHIAYAYQQNNSIQALMSNGTNEIQLMYSFGRKRAMRKQRKGLVSTPIPESALQEQETASKVKSESLAEESGDFSQEERGNNEDLDVKSNPDHADKDLKRHDEKLDEENKTSNQQELKENHFFKANENTYQMNIRFGFNSGVQALDSFQEGKLNELANFLKQHANVKLQIEGHTSDYGTKELNLHIGLKRAEEIRAMILVLGVPKSQITIESKYYLEPLFPKANKGDEIKHRRVVLNIID